MIQSLLRSMELLEVLKEKNRNFSIAELAEAMDLPPSTVHRILQTFCEKKYVIRDDRSHTYRLGPALIPLGKAAARGIRPPGCRPRYPGTAGKTDKRRRIPRNSSGK